MVKISEIGAKPLGNTLVIHTYIYSATLGIEETACHLHQFPHLFLRIGMHIVVGREEQRLLEFIELVLLLVDNSCVNCRHREMQVIDNTLHHFRAQLPETKTPS